MIREPAKRKAAGAQRDSRSTAKIPRPSRALESPRTHLLGQRVGNQAAQRLIVEGSGVSRGLPPLRTPCIQTKVEISGGGGAQEQEADRVADAVVRMPTADVAKKPAVPSSLSAANDTPQATSAMAANIRALRDGGDVLPADTRSFFEAHFNVDFSQVRLHTDARAEATARSLRAKAFTVGRDIAFGRGQYAPASHDGRRLLAHELTHVVQQSEGGAVIQRQPDPVAPDPLESLAADLASAITAPLLEITLKSPKAPKLTPKIVLKQQWAKIQPWIVGPKKGKKPPDLPKAFPGLAEPEIIDRLGALSTPDRTAVANRVLDLLLVDLGSETAETYRDEFSMLSPRVRGVIEPQADPIVGYVAMRDGLKATFGSIDALNTYFDTLVEANFPPVTTKIVGQHSLVHVELRNALDRAATLLKAKSAGTMGPGLFDAVVASIAGVDTLGGHKRHRGSWAASIRENRNRPIQIGNHSFGFAIDIHANLNPNLPLFPWHLVERLTGFDVYGPDVKGVRPGQSYDIALQSARRFEEASDRFRMVFDTQANFEKAMSDEARKAGMPVASADLFRAVVGASQSGKVGRQAFMALKALLLDGMNKEDARKAQVASSSRSGDSGTSIRIAAHEDPGVVFTIVSGLRSKVTSRADLERLMPVIKTQLLDLMEREPPSAKHPELAILFNSRVLAELRRVPVYIREYEMPNSIRQQLTPGVRIAEAAALAQFLVKLHRIFVSTRVPAGKRAGQKIASTDTLAGVAAHGFMNLMPELVAALTSKEGGNLLWLGSTAGTKDWHHFELSPSPKITPQGEWP